MAGPPGGIARSADGGAGNVVYGMLTDQYQPQQGMRGRAALNALIGEMIRDNPGVVPGPQREVTVNGVAGQSVECNNPSGNNGRGEQDQIIAFQQPDGTLRYFVFVAPTPDFKVLRPTFQKILQSLTMQF
jgi:hypothetical protein